MGSETTPEMLAMARRWMGKLPRNEFDHLLLLVAEAREDGSRTATELAAKLAESDSLILSESRSGGSFGKTRKDHGELIATALRNGEHYHDR